MNFVAVQAQEPLPDSLRGAVVGIGNMDGMHRGHQDLMAKVIADAKATTCKAGLVTFEPHPRTLFQPDDPVFRLSPQKLKSRLAQALGCHFTVSLDFDRALAGMEPEDFVRSILVERLGVSHVVSGFDFHFGKGRKGNPQVLRDLGNELGFAVSVIDQVSDDDGIAPFSSSTIRTALRHGHVTRAANQLGYWWTVIGTVVKGDQRGRTIGFPTANIVLEPGMEPAQGIYAVRVRINGSDKRHNGAAYIGTRPTFDTDRTFLEVFLFDFDDDIYGCELSVEFHSYIRGDQAFTNVDDLVKKMQADCEQARQILRRLDKDDPINEFKLGEIQSQQGFI